MFAVLGACAVIIVLRKPSAFTYAQFWAEDGYIWFGQAYNDGLWSTIFRPYSGTFSILTRLVGHLATHVPLRYAPLFFSTCALLIQLLPVFILNSSRMKKVVHYRLVAIFASIVYVSLPNSMEAFVNLANVQWHLGIASFLVLIAAKPAKRSWKIFDIVVLTVTGLTGPLGLTLVPIAFLIWYKERNQQSLRNLLVLGATSCLQLLSLFVIQPAQRGGHLDLSFVNAIKMITGQIFIGGVFGEPYVTHVYDNFLLYIVFAAGLLVIAYAIKNGPRWIAYANLFALIIFVTAIFSLTPLKGTNLWEILTHVNTGQRYWHIPIFVWLMTLLWTALAAKLKVLQGAAIILMFALVFIGIPNSWHIAPLPDKHYGKQVEKFNLQPAGKIYTIPINPDTWNIYLNKR